MLHLFSANTLLVFSFLFATSMSGVFAQPMSGKSANAVGEVVDVWLGTATPTKGKSLGIYHASLKTRTGRLSEPTLAVEVNSPGFLALHPSGKTLYSTGSATNANHISAFRITGPAGDAKLEWLNSVDTGDGGAAHLSTDHAGKVLISAQYGGGSTSLYQLADDGSIVDRVDVQSHSKLLPQAGSRVIAKRQDSPHAHWSGTSPDDRFAFVPDLGMDKVVIWELNNEAPSIRHHGFGICPPGGGPRHMRFSPDGSRIYVLNELALTVTVFDYDPETGTMTAGQTIPTLTEVEKSKETFNSASEIRVHPNGRFVYSANRGHDSITAFNVNDEGELSRTEVEPIRGAWPRNFNIDPTGQWIIAAGQESNTATVFEIDTKTGELTFIRQTQPVPEPICVVFGLMP